MIKRLLPYLKPLWVRLLVATICMAGVAAISTGVMWLMKYLIDHALNDKDMVALSNGIFLIITGFTLKSILWYAHTYLASYIGQAIARDLRDEVYGHLYTLSLGFFNNKTSGGILARLTNDITTLQIGLASAPTILIRDGLSVLGLIGFLFYLHWKFALICFSILPFAAYALGHLGVKSRRAGRESQTQMAHLYEVIQEALSAMPIVKSFQNEKKEMETFKNENKNYFNVIMRLVRVDARSSPIMEVLGSVALAMMLWFGGRDVISGVWTLGAFVAFVGAAMSLYNPIKKFAKVNVQIQQGLASAERVFQLLDEKGTVVDSSNAFDIQPFSSAICFDKVSFGYSKDTPVIHNIDLTINKGEIVALVGASGSGKSTLAQLLLRFYDPDLGAITIDGNNLRDVTVSSIRNQMAVVTQETHLFNSSIYENILYGKLTSTKEEVLNAAKAAHAHGFISSLKDGYETVIGERGARLSGGERQRLAIARALLKNPAILILDEATSALDAISEKEVQAALDALLKDRTVLVIAHRFATIKKANRIVLLEKGTIKEMGEHNELLEKKGSYHRLYELQTMQ